MTAIEGIKPELEKNLAAAEQLPSYAILAAMMCSHASRWHHSSIGSVPDSNWRRRVGSSTGNLDTNSHRDVPRPRAIELQRRRVRLTRSLLFRKWNRDVPNARSACYRRARPQTVVRQFTSSDRSAHSTISGFGRLEQPEYMERWRTAISR